MLNDYCNNDKCPSRYKCPIYVFLNEKVTNKFFFRKQDPKSCKHGGK